MAGTAPSDPASPRSVAPPAGESAPQGESQDRPGLVDAARNRMVNELVFLQGVTATKHTLREWSRHPWRVMRVWLFWSVVIALLLLTCVLIVAHYSTPDPSGVLVPGFNEPVDAHDVGQILFRNSLVLALHAFACVAGFIAGNSLPISAAKRSGLSRLVHEKAGPLSIGFVACATTFSLATQAYFLGLSLEITSS